MEKVKKIDIHAHATAFRSLTPYTWLTGNELVEMYDKLGIEKGVLLPIISPEGMTATLSNEGTKMVVDEHPDRFVWFCNVDPRSIRNTVNSDLSYLLEYYKKLGAKGLGELTSNIYVDDPKMDNLFRHCEECDMPVLFHISPAPGVNYGMVDEMGLPRLEKMLKKHPNLKFIGHSQPFWCEISSDITEEKRNGQPKGKVVPGRLTELMREYENLYCDLSAGSGSNAMMRDPEHAASFMTEFADRIFYGCDICAVTNTHPFYFRDFFDKMYEDNCISDTVYRKICRENAVKLLGLDVE